ncbi:MAG: alpha-D-glucose phosphate-specific phosphoglucomutase [Alphaproteobacteria bacterium]|nr:alpha-D-glucose phosphate-specific phosphoglucomutase [Alphaproteobacteria bacterium]MBN2780177.1 alpha-D-glucose phosphate-specific phosphoglucomutase [Alphaproteobacteria bacterium]
MIKTQKAIFYPEHNPRASGMRLATRDAMRPAFIETFVQSIFDVYRAQGKSIQSIVVGTDGRYFTVNARETVMRVALANGIKKIYTTPSGLMTTPAASLLTKEKADLNILLTASHNEGGLDKDFGIKVEDETGGIVPVEMCEDLISCMQKMDTYQTISDSSDALYLRPEIEFVDAIKFYADRLETLFDFDVLRDFLKNKPVILDSLHGASGPYLKEIFENRLGLKNLELRHNESLPDFAGGHPEPNPTFAKDLYQELLAKKEAIGCAFDADVDRYMIVSEGYFMAPPDLLALAAKNLSLAKGYTEGIAGVARSMPTARIVDYVAKDLGLPCYEVPTAWVFFTNLLNAGKITLCGEESFGIGSHHIQEKDGIWGLLVWLNTLAVTRQSTSEILTDLWTNYGRFYTCRYDYETTIEKAQNVFDYLATGPAGTFGGYTIESVDEFNFTDPVTGKQALHQGWVMSFTDGSRVITRLSNTGTKGALLRFYLEKREMKNFTADSFEITKDLGEAGLAAFDMDKYLGTINPDIIVKG